jgi:large subunit ribosomal protein L9
MRIIFITDVQGSGLAGEIKEVPNGYARNFLIPNNMAVLATHDHLQRVESIRKAGGERRIKEEHELKELAARLDGISITLTAKSSSSGRFYGSITSARITEELNSIINHEFDRRMIHLAEPIHEPGTYEAVVRLGYGISITIPVTAEDENAPAEQNDEKITGDQDQEETNTAAIIPIAEKGTENNREEVESQITTESAVKEENPEEV